MNYFTKLNILIKKLYQLLKIWKKNLSNILEVENLSKFTFTENDILSYIELIFGRKNKCKYKLNINLTINHKIEFKDDSHLICFSHDIFFELKNLLLAQYEEDFLRIQYRRYSLYHYLQNKKNLFQK